jgi:hypothetical protein
MPYDATFSELASFPAFSVCCQTIIIIIIIIITIIIITWQKTTGCLWKGFE